MSREIKFRAWHKKQSKMIYDVQKTEMVHHAMSSMAGEPSGLDHYFDEEWYELMQYTGLKDKNGNDIYEGDIVECYYWFNGTSSKPRKSGNRIDVFMRALQVLTSSCKLKFGGDVSCVPIVMQELLPERLGIELNCYERKTNEN